MHIIVTSISSKVPLLKAVKTAVSASRPEAQVYGADTNDKCIGQYFVDHFWPCPMLNQLYIDDFITYCTARQITVVIPTRDGELLYFARHKKLLAESGISVMVSDEAAVHLCLDKLTFSEQLARFKYPVIPSYRICPEGLSSYVVKERFGAGSEAIGVHLNEEQAKAHALQLKQPIFQPYITGSEYSVDVYVSRDGIAKGAIVRSRELVLHGESQITTTIRMPHVEKLMMQIAENYSFKGHIIFQILLDDSGQVHIIECNCRIGGASTLSFAVGLKSVYWFLQESAGVAPEQLVFMRSAEEKKLIRHAEDMVL